MRRLTIEIAGPAALAAAVLVAACMSATSRRGTPSAASDDCVIVHPSSSGSDTVTFTIADHVDLNHAPVPHNDSERLVYRHLYETVIRLDCNGQPVGGLADSWNSTDGGRSWEFVLSSDAKFWDGSRVTASDVARSWHAQGYWETLAVGNDSVVVVSEREIPIAVFAEQQMAIVKPASGSYPMGTGPYGVGERGDSGLTVGLLTRQREAVIRFRVVPEADARDVIDLGTDLLLTSDPRAVEYAAGRTGFEAVPLPWDRTYVAVTPIGRATTPGLESGDVLPEDLRTSLARDAVRTEARGSKPPYWWQELMSCPITPEAIDEAPLQTRLRGQVMHVVYRRDDSVSQDLAERLVALATSRDGSHVLSRLGVRSDLAERIAGGQGGLSAMALSAEQFAASLRWGEDLLYVMGLSRFEADPCHSAEELVGGAPWLVWSPGSRQPPSLVGLTGLVVPLVDTRSHAIVREGRVGLRVDWDGTVLVLMR